jgi:NAD(P)-dependent dehydrogenase (short-subunit alcohol dehydrogenase family)
VSAAKAALRNFTRTLASEQIGCVNAVSPGVIETSLRQALPEATIEELRQALLQQIPVKRFGKPSRTTSPPTFLASNQASSIMVSS